MHLTVRSINFADHAISLEIDRSITVSHFDYLQKYIDFCSTLGFSAIDIFYPTHIPVMAFVMLQELQKERQTAKSPATNANPVAAATDSSRSCEFECMRLQGDSGERIEYRVRFSDPAVTLDRLTTAVLLLGASIPLDEESQSYLRLCVYELAANSLEHGDFDGRCPVVTVSLSFTDTHIEVAYSDNSETFSTATKKSVDVGEIIKQRGKRGLGLFLLQNITEDLDYRRVGDENSTRFKIERRDKCRYDLNRRERMNTLSIAVIPTDSAETVVVKPSGSINSSTVQQLDASFSDALGSGHNTLVIDLSETDFISSSGVGLLLGTVATLREQGGDLVLMNIPKLINDIFDILNIKMHFRIVNDLGELKVAVKS